MSGDGNQNPFGYILIPVVGVGILVSVVSCYRYRRKKQHLARMVADPAYEAQLEAGRAQVGHRGPNGVIIVTNGGQAGGRRTGGRSRRLGLGAGMGSREEGLNELGEAPPAYMPSAPKPPSDGGVEHVELMTYSQATAAIGTSRGPPGYSGEPASGTAAGGSGDAARASGDTREAGADATIEATAAQQGQNQNQNRDESPPRYGDEPPTTTAAAADDSRNETRTTTENTTTTTTTTPQTIDEPTAPPRAVLPPS